MKILGQIIVHPTPSSQIARLTELAYNMWWSWNPAAQALYEEIDSSLWRRVNHNPVKFLRQVGQADLDRVAADPAYLARYRSVMSWFDLYMNPPAGTTWHARTLGQPEGGPQGLIAYFSAEFGLHEALPIYSGGLGILSGDHCKTASDLGLPFVGVGFLYPQGYFQQRIDGDGRQQAIYEKLDFSEVPAIPALDQDGKQVMINVDLPGRTVYAKLWRIQVGRVLVYLMDTDVDRNGPEDRELSARLYGGDQQIRVSQEIVLGIGGVRALRALGLQPAVWHMNEGHAAFLQLERIREYVHEQHLDYPSALWAVRSDALFTTHTPVPAGNDSFPFELMDRFFNTYWGQIGLDRDAFLALGRYDYAWGPQFSMTVLALRTAGFANGVSRLHGEVSRRMWRGLWPEVPQPEVPIGSITNGVHTDTWLHPTLAALLERYLAPSWREAISDPATWAALEQIPDAELWAQHNAAKAQMLDLVRERVVAQRMRNGATPADVNAGMQLFDPRALVIGFARRFATYKRATLLFRDPDRLNRILNNPDGPVQIIFSGKAHPADEPGKALIQAIYQLSRQPGFAGRIVFVEDYDANIARSLVAGVDVWMNTPRKPLEASGTSGQKAGLNGVPSFSVLDGWWTEGYSGKNGWAIGSGREYPTEAGQDEADALSIYSALEREIVPLYYTRDGEGIPRGWVAVVRATIESIAPLFSLDRMLKEYVSKYYGPASALGLRARADGFAGARALSDWQARVSAGWPGVGLTASAPADSQVSVGQSLSIRARLRLGRLKLDDLAVELVYGHPNDGDLGDARLLPLNRTGSKDGEVLFQADFSLPDSGSFVYGVRVRPRHDGLPNPFPLPLVRWA